MTRRDNGPLGGLVRRKLIREIALMAPGDTLSALAKKYGVSSAAMTKFKQRHADEIAAVAKDADDEFAGMLIAQKAFRLGLLQEIAEKAGEAVPKVTPAGKVAYDEDGNQIMEIDYRAQMAALKQAAEELGQLANRMTISGDINTTTTYRIVNVTDDDLT